MLGERKQTMLDKHDSSKSDKATKNFHSQSSGLIPYFGFLWLSMKNYPIFRNLCPRMLGFRIPFLRDFGKRDDIHINIEQILPWATHPLRYTTQKCPQAPPSARNTTLPLKERLSCQADVLTPCHPLLPSGIPRRMPRSICYLRLWFGFQLAAIPIKKCIIFMSSPKKLRSAKLAILTFQRFKTVLRASRQTIH